MVQAIQKFDFPMVGPLENQATWWPFSIGKPISIGKQNSTDPNVLGIQALTIGEIVTYSNHLNTGH